MRSLIVAAALILGACGLTPQGDAVRDAIRERGADVADEGLKNAAWAVCNAVSHGAVERVYQQGTAKRRAYDTFCGFGPKEMP